MKKMKALLLGAILMMGMASAAYAIPSLQLDIVGGTYDTGTETIIASSNSFTLNALLLADDKDNLIGDTYFISAALIPINSTTEPGGNFGSFKIGTTTYNVTSDMVYGTPPLDALYPDLGKHSIFATWYKEISFVFPTTQYNAYDAEDNPGTTPTAGSGMYVNSFAIDISGLTAGIGIHFDLYNENITKTGKYDTLFAPFSHDAQSGPPVPEPGTMMLLGVGMFGLAIFGKRRMNK